MIHSRLATTCPNARLKEQEWTEQELEDWWKTPGLETDKGDALEADNADDQQTMSYCDEEIVEPVPMAGVEPGDVDPEPPVPSSSKGPLTDDFVDAVVNDPNLGLDRATAIQVLGHITQKMKALGLNLTAMELKHQLDGGVPNTFPPSAKDEFPPSAESEPKVKDNRPPGALTPAEVEKMHEDWNSSGSITASPGSAWDLTEEELEEKIAKVDPRDAHMVATLHEIKKEKTYRRSAHLAKTAEAGCEVQWSQLTKKGFHDFLLQCEGQQPQLPIPVACNKQEKVVKPAQKRVKAIRWGPIRQEGIATFVAKFGQDNVAPVDYEAMDTAACGLCLLQCPHRASREHPRTCG